MDAVNSYGGLVFHDVINRRHAEKASEAGVDGIIAVSAGAGGHTGTMSPFALATEIREVFDGTIVLGGAISTGRHIAAARMMGADVPNRLPRRDNPCGQVEFQCMLRFCIPAIT